MISEDFVTNIINTYPLAEGKIAFDIGAHHGKFTELLALKFDKVYAFEPFPDNIKILKEKFGNNPNVVIIEKGVHKTNGTERLFINGISDQGSITKAYADREEWKYNPNSFIDIETITLDTFCEQENIQNLSFMKIDIEGAEQYIFDGATKTLSEFPLDGWIILECHLLVDWKMVSDKLSFHNFGFINTDLLTVPLMNACNHYLIHKGEINFI